MSIEDLEKEIERRKKIDVLKPLKDRVDGMSDQQKLRIFDTLYEYCIDQMKEIVDGDEPKNFDHWSMETLFTEILSEDCFKIMDDYL
jgi:hypothetical protein